MSLPKYNELFEPFLKVIQNGDLYSVSEVADKIAIDLNIPETELREMIASGKQTVFRNRVAWARTYLKKAGLISSPQRAKVAITPEGKRLFAENISITTRLMTERYPSFAEFSEGARNLTNPLMYQRKQKRKRRRKHLSGCSRAFRISWQMNC